MKFKKAYQAMQAELNPTERLIRRTVAAAHPEKNRPVYRMRTTALIAAVLALVLVISLPVMAGSGISIRWLEKVAPEQAADFTPVQMSTEDAGIRLEVANVYTEDDITKIYFTLTDLLQQEGGTLNETVQLLDNHWHLTPSYAATIPEPIVEYDAQTQTAHFLLTVEDVPQAGTPEKPETDLLTFSLDAFTTGFGYTPITLSAVDLANIDLSPEIEKMESGNACGVCAAELIIENTGEYKGSKYYYEFLTPYAEPIPLSEDIPGYALSGLAYRNGRLHVQILDSSEMLHLEAPMLHILCPDGSVMDLSGDPFIIADCSGSVSTHHSRDSTSEYREYVFEVSLEDLDGCSIGGYFPVAERVVRGDWQVTFPLKETN